MDIVLCVECVDQPSFRQYGPLDYDDAIEAAEDILGLSHEDIGGVQPIGMKPRFVNFVTTREAYWRRSCQDGLHEKRRLSSGKIVSVSLPNTDFTEVYVKHAPLDWSDVKLERIFRCYGEVRGIEHMTIKSKDTRSRNYVGKRNGISKLKMKIKENIPSNMKIENARIEIYYNDQVRTCWRCGGGHKR